MNLLRALVLLFALSSGLLGGGVLDSHVSTAAAASLSAPAAEDASTQGKAVAEAYNLLLDHYVHPPDTAALLNAGWDNLVKEADGKAVAPGTAPAFDGDRAADLETMRTALAAYLDKPNSEPDGFVAAHALVRGMVRFIDEGHTYFLDPQQYRDYQSWSRGDNTYVGFGISVTAIIGLVVLNKYKPAARTALGSLPPLPPSEWPASDEGGTQQIVGRERR